MPLDPRPDFDWKKELKNKPAERKGFDDKLKQRIEEQIEARERLRRKWLLTSIFSTAALTLMALLFIRLGPLPSPGVKESAEATNNSIESASPPKVMMDKAPPVIKTALLVGLRTDYQPGIKTGSGTSSPYSTYRTLLIAPEEGELKVASEGSGILMPYGMKFWKIEALNHETPTDTIHYLSAHPADQPVEKADLMDDPSQQLVHTEKLLFAGNQYLSITETDSLLHDLASPAESKRILVLKLPQLTVNRLENGSRFKTSSSHVSIQEVYGSTANSSLSAYVPKSAKGTETTSPITGESWGIIRKAGRWTAQVAETYRSAGGRYDGFELRDFPDPLPVEVVNHDKLCCTWKQILELEPNVTDALSSPLDDMMILFADGELNVYSPYQTMGEAPLLTVPLKPGEQLVMAQWATGGYVSEWIAKTRKYLK